MPVSRPRRVLFVSYLFPPVGGVGVHRVTKFVKFLPQYGWQSSVLTVSNPSVPLHDESLLRDIPPGTILRRAKTWEPGYAVKQAVAAGNGAARRRNPFVQAARDAARRLANFLLQPDSQILWHPHAFKAGKQLLDDVPHAAIIASGPPFSSLLLGARLARHSGLPLILDYRDEWDISNDYWENKQHSRLTNAIQSRQQATALKAASRIVATTPSSTAAVAELAKRAGRDVPARCIYNGFDPDDYATDVTPFPDCGAPTTANRPQRFRLAFIGTLWNLNSIAPVIAAVERLIERSPQLACELELLLAGRRTDEQNALVDRLLPTPVHVTRLPFVSHSEAVGLMRSADMLLMLNSDVPQAQRIINAKTFEYMAARRPLFVVAPRGDVWDVVRDLPGTVLCEPADVAGISENLELALEQHRCGLDHRDAHWDISRFERLQLAGELADLLDDVTGLDQDSALRLSPATNGVERPL